MGKITQNENASTPTTQRQRRSQQLAALSLSPARVKSPQMSRQTKSPISNKNALGSSSPLQDVGNQQQMQQDNVISTKAMQLLGAGKIASNNKVPSPSSAEKKVSPSSRSKQRARAVVSKKAFRLLMGDESNSNGNANGNVDLHAVLAKHTGSGAVGAETRGVNHHHPSAGNLTPRNNVSLNQQQQQGNGSHNLQKASSFSAPISVQKFLKQKMQHHKQQEVRVITPPKSKDAAKKVLSPNSADSNIKISKPTKMEEQLTSDGKKQSALSRGLQKFLQYTPVLNLFAKNYNNDSKTQQQQQQQPMTPRGTQQQLQQQQQQQAQLQQQQQVSTPRGSAKPTPTKVYIPPLPLRPIVVDTPYSASSPVVQRLMTPYEQQSAAPVQYNAGMQQQQQQQQFTTPRFNTSTPQKFMAQQEGAVCSPIRQAVLPVTPVHGVAIGSSSSASYLSSSSSNLANLGLSSNSNSSNVSSPIRAMPLQLTSPVRGTPLKNMPLQQQQQYMQPYVPSVSMATMSGHHGCSTPSRDHYAQQQQQQAALDPVLPSPYKRVLDEFPSTPRPSGAAMPFRSNPYAAAVPVEIKPFSQLSVLDQFNSTIRSEEMRSHFEAFCKLEYSTENIDFWRIVEFGFRRLKNRNQRLGLAKLVYNQFVDPSAVAAININTAIISKISKRIKGMFFNCCSFTSVLRSFVCSIFFSIFLFTAKISECDERDTLVDLFDEVQTVVQNNMVDTYYRFTNSELFQNMVKELNLK